MIVYRCEATIESVFTAVYLAYEEKRDLKDTRLVLHQDPILFAQDVPVVGFMSGGMVIGTVSEGVCKYLA